MGEIAMVTKLAGFEFTKFVKYSDTGEIIALRGLNIKKGKLILTQVKFIDNSDLSKLSRSKLIKNDIVYSYVGTVGESAIIPESDKYYLAPNVALIRISIASSSFVNQEISSNSFKQRIVFPLVSSSSQPALSMKSIRQFVLLLPSLSEQTQVGTILNHVDKLIAANE